MINRLLSNKARMLNPTGQRTTRIQSPPEKKSYASLFKDNRAPQESSRLHFIHQPVGDIKLALDEIETVENTHGFCLVWYVYGNRPGTYDFVNFIKGWGDKVKFVFKENEWIKFQFPNATDRDRILNGGPYMIQGRQLFLEALPSCFLYSKDEMMPIPSWVKILGFPAECCTTKALSKIASMVGKPIQTDKMTISKKGSNYVRVLVGLDATHPWVWEQVLVLPNGNPIHIQFKYELDPKYCEKCNSLGHNLDMCGVKVTRRRYKRPYKNKATGNEDLLEGEQELQDENPGTHFPQGDGNLDATMPEFSMENKHAYSHHESRVYNNETDEHLENQDIEKYSINPETLDQVPLGSTLFDEE